MRLVKGFLIASLPAILLLASMSAAHAERPGIYLGVSAGEYRVNAGDFHDNDHLVKAHAGAQFNDWFGIEGSWVDFNRSDQANGRFKADGKGLSAVISLPFSETSSLFIKGGQFWWDSDTNIGSSATAATHDGNDPFYGAGLKLGFSKNVALRVEYERYKRLEHRSRYGVGRLAI